MIANSPAKINLGLNIISRRNDGFHNIETVFVTIPLYDTLEISIQQSCQKVDKQCTLQVDGIKIDCPSEKNIVIKAYDLLSQIRQLPPLFIRLHKRIPVQAGLGGGSSNGAMVIKMINNLCSLNLTKNEMLHLLGQLGSDCSFFLNGGIAYAEGRGEILHTMKKDLNGWYIIVIKPEISISTAQMYHLITPHKPEYNCRDIVNRPIESWKDLLKNDFEEPALSLFPEIKEIKDNLYAMGATYASMSGSGSSIFALFSKIPNIAEESTEQNTTLQQQLTLFNAILQRHFAGMFTFVGIL